MRKYAALCFTVAVLIAGLIALAQKKPAPRQRSNSTSPSSPQQNQVLARRVFEELTNQGRYSEVDSVFDRTCKVHFGNRTEALSQAVAEGKGWKSAAPDLFINVESVSQSGDKVTVLWSARGTHTGQGLGVKPTRRQVSMRDRSVFLIKNGKIVEAWNSEYRQELFRQLGVSKTAAFLMEKAMDLHAALTPLLPSSASSQ